MLQVKAEIIGKRYVNAELDLFGRIGIIGNYEAIGFMAIVLHLLQCEPHPEHTVGRIGARPVSDNCLEVADGDTFIAGKIQPVNTRLNLVSYGCFCRKSRENIRLVTLRLSDMSESPDLHLDVFL